MRKPTNRGSHVGIAFALLLLLSAHLPAAYARGYDGDERREHDRYLFSATRSVNEMDTAPVLKLTLLPGAVLIDLVFLPFEAVADALS